MENCGQVVLSSMNAMSKTFIHRDILFYIFYSHSKMFKNICLEDKALQSWPCN